MILRTKMTSIKLEKRTLSQFRKKLLCLELNRQLRSVMFIFRGHQWLLQRSKNLSRNRLSKRLVVRKGTSTPSSLSETSYRILQQKLLTLLIMQPRAISRNWSSTLKMMKSTVSKCCQTCRWPTTLEAKKINRERIRNLRHGEYPKASTRSLCKSRTTFWRSRSKTALNYCLE